MEIKDIKKVLDELGIKYLKDSSKETLWQLIPAAIASQIHNAETIAADAEAAKLKAEEELEAKKKAEAEAKAEADLIAKANTPKEAAWIHFCRNMEKREPVKYAKMKESGELDKIKKDFTYVDENGMRVH